MTLTCNYHYFELRPYLQKQSLKNSLLATRIFLYYQNFKVDLLLCICTIHYFLPYTSYFQGEMKFLRFAVLLSFSGSTKSNISSHSFQQLFYSWSHAGLNEIFTMQALLIIYLSPRRLVVNRELIKISRACKTLVAKKSVLSFESAECRKWPGDTLFPQTEAAGSVSQAAAESTENWLLGRLTATQKGCARVIKCI